METKAWYESKTVWGGVIALLAGVAGAFGFDIGAEDQETIINSILAVSGAVGGLLAIYGRVSSKTKIG